MKKRTRSSLFVALFLILGVSIFLSALGLGLAAQTSPSTTLSNDDCIKCHAVPPADMMANGGKHKAVGCLGCHTGHRPAVKDNIPKCNMCHMGKPHYELKDCLGCHKNPHTPLMISFASNVTDACVTCHTQQITQLRDQKSKHTALNCSTCHNVHGKIPACMQCHKPHSADMTVADCKKCHKAHMPKAVSYAADIPSKDCGSCHTNAFALLTASSSKHKALACAFCHQAVHKMVPKCQDCHGVPHAAGMMARFTKCGDCHNTAHDLNHWTPGAKKEEPKEPKEIKKKK